MQPLLFVRIGWARDYRGDPADMPVGGGSYTKRHRGHERFNFKADRGRVYGYIPAGKQLDLRRINPAVSGSFVTGVLVVYVATTKQKRGQYVVGWYENATVYRDSQPAPGKGRQRVRYYAMTDQNDAVLVPEPTRNERVPRGKNAMGTRDICYTLAKNGTRKPMPWVARILRYVNNYRRHP